MANNCGQLFTVFLFCWCYSSFVLAGNDKSVEKWNVNEVAEWFVNQKIIGSEDFDAFKEKYEFDGVTLSYAFSDPSLMFDYLKPNELLKFKKSAKMASYETHALVKDDLEENVQKEEEKTEKYVQESVKRVVEENSMDKKDISHGYETEVAYYGGDSEDVIPLQPSSTKTKKSKSNEMVSDVKQAAINEIMKYSMGDVNQAILVFDAVCNIDVILCEIMHKQTQVITKLNDNVIKSEKEMEKSDDKHENEDMRVKSTTVVIPEEGINDRSESYAQNDNGFYNDDRRDINSKITNNDQNKYEFSFTIDDHSHSASTDAVLQQIRHQIQFIHAGMQLPPNTNQLDLQWSVSTFDDSTSKKSPRLLFSNLENPSLNIFSDIEYHFHLHALNGENIIASWNQKYSLPMTKAESNLHASHSAIIDIVANLPSSSNMDSYEFVSNYDGWTLHSKNPFNMQSKAATVNDKQSAEHIRMSLIKHYSAENVHVCVMHASNDNIIHDDQQSKNGGIMYYVGIIAVLIFVVFIGRYAKQKYFRKTIADEHISNVQNTKNRSRKKLSSVLVVGEKSEAQLVIEKVFAQMGTPYLMREYARKLADDHISTVVQLRNLDVNDFLSLGFKSKHIKAIVAYLDNSETAEDENTQSDLFDGSEDDSWNPKKKNITESDAECSTVSDFDDF